MRLKSIILLWFILSITYASAQDDAPKMSINILDPATGAGLEDVRLRWRDFRNGSQVKGEAVTGTDGLVLIPMPKKGAQFVQFYLSKPGYVTLRAYWPYRGKTRGMVGDIRGTEEPPEQYELTMEPAVRAFGKVVDQDDHPIEGATVVISANKKLTTPNLATDIVMREVKTSADGVFSIDDAPKPIDVAQIGVFHPLYGNSAEGLFQVSDYPTPDKLLDGSAKFVLSKGVLIEGMVTGPDGKPLPGATIMWGNMRSLSNVLPEVVTDADGKYRIGSQPNITATITVKSRGMAPELKKAEIKTDNTRLDFQLSSARKITGKVVAPKGQRFNNGYVYISTWRGASTINQQIWFGSDGRFYWNEAPLDEVDLLINAYGFPSQIYKLRPDDKDVTINLKENNQSETGN